MNAVNDILRQVPMSQLARQLGTDEATAEQAARQAVASLVGGMQNNASDDAGAQSLAGALRDHSSSPFITKDEVDLDEVDTNEGKKIVGHVLGDEQHQLQALGGGGGGLLNSPQAKQLLRTLAPIVLAYLAGQVTSGKYGNVLGDILGGGDQARPQQDQQQQKDSSGIGDILGDVLGGGSSRRQGGGGLLGGILGSILGGGR